MGKLFTDDLPNVNYICITSHEHTNRLYKKNLLNREATNLQYHITFKESDKDGSPTMILANIKVNNKCSVPLESDF